MSQIESPIRTHPTIEPFNPATVLAGVRRPDFELISSWVPQGVHVLDLGCGDGTLLSKLMRERGVTGYGIEKNDRNIATTALMSSSSR